MADIDVARPGVPRDPAHIEAPHAEHDCAKSVLSAYTTAIGRLQSERSAYDAAVRTYLLYHPNAPEPAARQAVARIITWKE